MNKISAIVITFKPDLSRLRALVNGLAIQGVHVLIINNGDAFELSFEDQWSVDIFHLGFNAGLGFATNYGVKICSNLGSTHVMLCDQDTLFSKDYISEMTKYFESGFSVLVPRYFDVISGFEAKSFKESHQDHRLLIDHSTPTPVTQAIASGMIIEIGVFQKQFFFNEELFIDWVDFEWCWRVRAAGLKIGLCESVLIHHTLGDHCRNIFGKKINLRNPLRHYYITRNAVFLALYSPYLPLGQRLKIILKVISYIIVFPIISRPFCEHLVATTLGAVHGISQRLGSKKNKS